MTQNTCGISLLSGISKTGFENEAAKAQATANHYREQHPQKQSGKPQQRGQETQNPKEQEEPPTRERKAQEPKQPNPKSLNQSPQS